MPMRVELTIGGQAREFEIGDSLFKNVINQIYIKPKSFKISENYNDLAKILDDVRIPSDEKKKKGNHAEKLNDIDKTFETAVIQRRAMLILNSINSKLSEQINWEHDYVYEIVDSNNNIRYEARTESRPGHLPKNSRRIRTMYFAGSNDEPSKAAAMLIVITQVAESSQPEGPFLKQLQTLRNSEVLKYVCYKDKDMKKNGRVPGSDKDARGKIRQIEKEGTKFKNIFGDDGKYLPSQKGGTQKQRNLMMDARNKRRKCSLGEDCEDSQKDEFIYMSDPTDNENDNERSFCKLVI